MVSDVRADVALDRCLDCGGLWFDATELDRHLAFNLVPQAQVTEATIPPRGRSARTCPRCRPKLLQHAGWPALLLDRCNTCHGLFLDGGELEALKAQAPTLDVAQGSVEAALAIHAAEFVLGGTALFELLVRVAMAIAGG